MTLARLDPQDLSMVLDTLSDFLRREAPLSKRLAWDRGDECPEAVVRAMLSPEVGLHLVFLPEDCGGLGGGARDLYRMSEEFARVDLGLATAMLAIALGTDPIRVGATPEQRAHWLGRVAEEGLIVAYGVTEPEAGSHVENLKTTATPVAANGERPTGYLLRGQKQFISNGGIADLMTILARAPEGPSFFVVERGAAGLSAGNHEVKHGIRLSNTASVLLEDVFVPRENLIGEVEGQGIRQANEVFGYTRLMVAGFGLGCGDAALDRAIAYSKERRQFGQLLRDLKGFTHKLIVPHAVRLAGARAYVEMVADLLDAGDGNRQVEGSVAKLYATEVANRTADDAIQALGGYGYCVEFEVEKIKRDARILTIYEGTSEIQQSIVGTFRIRQEVRSKGAFFADLASGVEEFDEVGGLAVGRTARFLGEAIARAFKARLTRHQHVLFELAWCIAEVEVAAALVRKAAREPEERHQRAARLLASEVSLDVPVRVLRLIPDLADRVDLNEIVRVQPETLADLDELARILTA